MRALMNSVDTGLNEFVGLHGSRPETIRGLWEHGTSTLYSKATGNQLGNGVYVADCLGKTDQYSPPDLICGKFSGMQYSPPDLICGNQKSNQAPRVEQSCAADDFRGEKQSDVKAIFLKDDVGATSERDIFNSFDGFSGNFLQWRANQLTKEGDNGKLRYAFLVKFVAGKFLELTGHFSKFRNQRLTVLDPTNVYDSVYMPFGAAVASGRPPAEAEYLIRDDTMVSVELMIAYRPLDERRTDERSSPALLKRFGVSQRFLGLTVASSGIGFVCCRVGDRVLVPCKVTLGTGCSEHSPVQTSCMKGFTTALVKGLLTLRVDFTPWKDLLPEDMNAVDREAMCEYFRVGEIVQVSIEEVDAAPQSKVTNIEPVCLVQVPVRHDIEEVVYVKTACASLIKTPALPEEPGLALVVGSGLLDEKYIGSYVAVKEVGAKEDDDELGAYAITAMDVGPQLGGEKEKVETSMIAAAAVGSHLYLGSADGATLEESFYATTERAAFSDLQPSCLFFKQSVAEPAYKFGGRVKGILFSYLYWEWDEHPYVDEKSGTVRRSNLRPAFLFPQMFVTSNGHPTDQQTSSLFDFPWKCDGFAWLRTVDPFKGSSAPLRESCSQVLCGVGDVVRFKVGVVGVDHKFGVITAVGINNDNEGVAWVLEVQAPSGPIVDYTVAQLERDGKLAYTVAADFMLGMDVATNKLNFPDNGRRARKEHEKPKLCSIAVRSDTRRLKSRSGAGPAIFLPGTVHIKTIEFANRYAPHGALYELPPKLDQFFSEQSTTGMDMEMMLQTPKASAANDVNALMAPYVRLAHNIAPRLLLSLAPRSPLVSPARRRPSPLTLPANAQRECEESSIHGEAMKIQKVPFEFAAKQMTKTNWRALKRVRDPTQYSTKVYDDGDASDDKKTLDTAVIDIRPPSLQTSDDSLESCQARTSLAVFASTQRRQFVSKRYNGECMNYAAMDVSKCDGCLLYAPAPEFLSKKNCCREPSAADEASSSTCSCVGAMELVMSAAARITYQRPYCCQQGLSVEEAFGLDLEAFNEKRKSLSPDLEFENLWQNQEDINDRLSYTVTLAKTGPVYPGKEAVIGFPRKRIFRKNHNGAQGARKIAYTEYIYRKIFLRHGTDRVRDAVRSILSSPHEYASIMLATFLGRSGRMDDFPLPAWMGKTDDGTVYGLRSLFITQAWRKTLFPNPNRDTTKVHSALWYDRSQGGKDNERAEGKWVYCALRCWLEGKLRENAPLEQDLGMLGSKLEQDKCVVASVAFGVAHKMDLMRTRPALAAKLKLGAEIANKDLRAVYRNVGALLKSDDELLSSLFFRKQRAIRLWNFVHTNVEKSAGRGVGGEVDRTASEFWAWKSDHLPPRVPPGPPPLRPPAELPPPADDGPPEDGEDIRAKLRAAEYADEEEDPSSEEDEEEDPPSEEDEEEDPALEEITDVEEDPKHQEQRDQPEARNDASLHYPLAWRTSVAEPPLPAVTITVLPRALPNQSGIANELYGTVYDNHVRDQILLRCAGGVSGCGAENAGCKTPPSAQDLPHLRRKLCPVLHLRATISDTMCQYHALAFGLFERSSEAEAEQRGQGKFLNGHEVRNFVDKELRANLEHYRPTIEQDYGITVTDETLASITMQSFGSRASLQAFANWSRLNVHVYQPVLHANVCEERPSLPTSVNVERVQPSTGKDMPDPDNDYISVLKEANGPCFHALSRLGSQQQGRGIDEVTVPRRHSTLKWKQLGAKAAINAQYGYAHGWQYVSNWSMFYGGGHMVDNTDWDNSHSAAAASRFLQLGAPHKGKGNGKQTQNKPAAPFDALPAEDLSGLDPGLFVNAALQGQRATRFDLLKPDIGTYVCAQMNCREAARQALGLDEDLDSLWRKLNEKADDLKSHEDEEFKHQLLAGRAVDDDHVADEKKKKDADDDYSDDDGNYRLYDQQTAPGCFGIRIAVLKENDLVSLFGKESHTGPEPQLPAEPQTLNPEPRVLKPQPPAPRAPRNKLVRTLALNHLAFGRLLRKITRHTLSQQYCGLTQMEQLVDSRALQQALKLAAPKFVQGDVDHSSLPMYRGFLKGSGAEAYRRTWYFLNILHYTGRYAVASRHKQAASYVLARVDVLIVLLLAVFLQDSGVLWPFAQQDTFAKNPVKFDNAASLRNHHHRGKELFREYVRLIHGVVVGTNSRLRDSFANFLEASDNHKGLRWVEAAVFSHQCDASTVAGVVSGSDLDSRKKVLESNDEFEFLSNAPFSASAFGADVTDITTQKKMQGVRRAVDLCLGVAAMLETTRLVLQSHSSPLQDLADTGSDTSKALEKLDLLTRRAMGYC